MQTFADLIAGMDRAYLCRFLGIHRTTLSRWIAGEAQPPQSAVLALRMHLDGDLSALGGDDWHGFRLGRDGKLYAPTHHRPFDPFQLQAMLYTSGEGRYWKSEAHRLSLEVDALRAQLEKEKAHAWALEKLRGLSVPL